MVHITFRYLDNHLNENLEFFANVPKINVFFLSGVLLANENSRSLEVIFFKLLIRHKINIPKYFQRLVHTE